MAGVDNLVELLLEIARDGFPDIFQVDEELRFYIPASSTLSTRAIYGHANVPVFAEAIREDPDLAVFAPDGAFINTNHGSGWRVQASTLAGSLVTSAALAVIAKGLPTDDQALFEAEVVSTYESFRRLVRGEVVQTLVLLGYDGLTLRDGVRIDLTWGSLRPAHPLEAVAAPFVLAPTCVLEVTADLHFQIGEPNQDGRVIEAPEAVARARHLLGLAALLGVPRAEPLSPAPVWETTMFPAMAGRGFSGTGRSISPFHAVSPTPRGGGEALSERGERALAEWAEFVEGRHDPAIDVAIRRIMLALLERRDAADSLVDAVIALENLFGHGGTTEVVFRVTAAAAHLLERDAAKRAEFRRELGKVYDIRSKVIHGAEITAKDKLADRKERAIETVIDALRMLFAERPQLIADRERGMRLVLGTAGI